MEPVLYFSVMFFKKIHCKQSNWFHKNSLNPFLGILCTILYVYSSKIIMDDTLTLAIIY